MTLATNETLISMNQNVRQYRRKGLFQKSVCQFIANLVSMTDDMRQLRQAFRSIDSRNNGHICREDMRKFIDDQTSNNMQASASFEDVFNSIDIDGDGEISFSEFISAATCKNILIAEK